MLLGKEGETAVASVTKSGRARPMANLPSQVVACAPAMFTQSGSA